MVMRMPYFKFRRRQVVLYLFMMVVFFLKPAGISGQTAPSVSEDIRVYVSVMDPQTVSDVFGKRIAQRFVALQVTIRNRDRDHQFLIHDVSLDLENVFPPGYFTTREELSRTDCDKRRRDCEERNKTRTNPRDCGSCSGYKYELSSLELSLLRGVAEKGQSENGRNKLLRIFEGIGTVAAGLIGVAGFGPSYSDSIALYNGEFLAAYRHVFPDYTINQMNRLSDSAYQSNTLVPKQQARVLVAFIPQRIFLTKKQRDDFWKEPTLLFDGDKAVDFRRTEVAVRGSFIVELENLPVALNSVQFDDAELKKFQNDKKLDGTPSHKRLNFIIESDKPVAPDTPLTFEVSSDQSVQTLTRRIHYTPDLPTITDIDKKEGESNTPALEVEITGTNFVPGKTRVLVSGTGVKVPDNSVEVLGSTKLKATFTIDKNADPTERKVTVKNPRGESTGSISFSVVSPKP